MEKRATLPGKWSQSLSRRHLQKPELSSIPRKEHVNSRQDPFAKTAWTPLKFGRSADGTAARARPKRRPDRVLERAGRPALGRPAAKPGVVLAPVAEILIDRARPKAGERILDIGCGAGATTFALAQKTGPAGRVLGVDVSAPMLTRARQVAPKGLPVEFILADATVYPFEPAAFDLLASRFGVMFFAEPALSFANLRKALKPSGRLAFACWREPRNNPFFMAPLQAVYQHVPKLPQPGPEDPGPFSFASEARVNRVLSEAGFPESGWSRANCRSISRSEGARRRGSIRARDRAGQPRPCRAAGRGAYRREAIDARGAGGVCPGIDGAASRIDLDRDGVSLKSVPASGPCSCLATWMFSDLRNKA